MLNLPKKRLINWWDTFQNIPASRSSGNALVSESGDLSFKSRTNQIGLSVTDGIGTVIFGDYANGSPPLQISLIGAVLPGSNNAEMGHTNSLHVSAYCSEYNETFDIYVFFNWLIFLPLRHDANWLLSSPALRQVALASGSKSFSLRKPVSQTILTVTPMGTYSVSTDKFAFSTRGIKQAKQQRFVLLRFSNMNSFGV